MKCPKPRLVLVPYPAQGHVSPMLQLAHAFHRRGFEAIVVNTETVHSRLVQNNGGRENMEGVVLMSISDGLGDDKGPRDFFSIHYAMENTMPSHLDKLLDGLDGKGRGGGVVCVIVDLLASYALEVAKHRRIPAAGFWPAMLATYNLISSIPLMIDKGIVDKDGAPVQQDGAMRFLPGQPILGPNELPWLVGPPAARKSRFNFWSTIIQRCRDLPWLLVNSFPREHMEKLLQEAVLPSTVSHCYPRVLHVGPLSKLCKSNNPSFWEEDHSCLEWLGKHDPGSVIYVSFGSWVRPIGEGRMVELALGLEATRRPFLLVLNPTWQSLLPSGFRERVGEEVGKIVAWAPQREVLGHEAVGCFLTHCGWNSTVEAIEGGKRLLCYPISGDQFVNCAFIVKVWRIGVQVGGARRRKDVKDGVRRVMEDGEGDELLKRVLEFKAMVMGQEATFTAQASLDTFGETMGRRRRVSSGQCLPCL